MRPASSLVVSALLAVVGVIHLLPLAGVLGAERLRLLYGVAIEDPGLLLLLRHRAVLFGLLGAALLCAAWRPQWTGPALLAGWISVLSFLGLAWLQPGYGPAIGRIVHADAVAAACLALATALWLEQQRSGTAAASAVTG